MQRKIWKRGAAFYRKRKALGTAYEVADKVGTAGRWCWPYSGPNLQRVLPVVCFDHIAIRLLLVLNFLNRLHRQSGMKPA